MDVLRRSLQELHGRPADYDFLMAAIAESRFVLLGEASHGTHEFYRERAEITKRLIKERKINAVAAEADWPDAYRVNRYVRGLSDDADAAEALRDFRRFPAWMWRNTVMIEFVEWLRDFNRTSAGAEPIGFYGMDLYSLHASMGAVLRYLEDIDPEAAARARGRYSCFDHFGSDPQSYGYATAQGVESCEDQVVDQLMELRRNAAELAQRDGKLAEDEFFFAEQNARLARNAEAYYRSMFRGRVSSWNLRDRHMVETLEALEQHLAKRVSKPKIAVWAHNSHLGDARATEMSQRGELNVGQLTRTRWETGVFLIGFTTYEGTVTAATDWDGPAERKRVRPGLPHSYESLFHELDVGNFGLLTRADPNVERRLRGPLLERAIGVIYRPETERLSHYFEAQLARQFDAVLHFDHTRAVEPLERTSLWVPDEAPNTFPTSL